MSNEGEAGVGYTPEAVEPEEGDLFCFLSQDRLCSATCMAYTTKVPEKMSPELTPAQHRCTLLTSVERGSRHLVILASIGASIDRRQKNEVVDRKREAQTPTAPPNPFNPFGSKS